MRLNIKSFSSGPAALSAWVTTFSVAGLCLIESLPVRAQMLDPYYAGTYNVRGLGPVPGLPGHNGGLAFKAGDPNMLLIGGNANNSEAAVYQIPVTRDGTGHIVGFTNTADFFANANGPAGGGIDGGLAYGPGNVLFYTSFPDNALGEIKPGQTNPGRLIDLDAVGIDGSVGSLAFVPSGMPGAGQMKILSYGSENWYGTSLVSDNNGGFDVTLNGKVVPLGFAPEGAFFVRSGNALFPKASVLIGEYSAGSIGVYEVDAGGDPLIETRRLFMSVTKPEGSAVDPLTGDFLFSSFVDGSSIMVVGGFGIAPPSVSLTAPSAGATFGAPASFVLAANAEQTNGIVSQVQFFAGTNLLGGTTLAPYTISVDNLAAGHYALTAIVSDGAGNSSTSSVVNVTVTNIPPQISIVSPANGSSLPPCSSFRIVGKVLAGSGTPTNVEFYLGGSKIGNSTNSSFSFEVSDLPVGANVLTATVTDSFGLTATSGEITVNVALSVNQMAGREVGTNQFIVCFLGLPGTNYILEATSDLASPTAWTPIQTNQAGANILQFFDTDVPKHSIRFYRARRQ